MNNVSPEVRKETPQGANTKQRSSSQQQQQQAGSASREHEPNENRSMDAYRCLSGSL